MSPFSKIYRLRESRYREYTISFLPIKLLLLYIYIDQLRRDIETTEKEKMKIGQITKPRTGSPRGGKFKRKKIAEECPPAIYNPKNIRIFYDSSWPRQISQPLDYASPRIAGSRRRRGKKKRKKKKFMIIMVMSREAKQPTVSLACCQPMYNVLVRLGGRKFTVTNGSPVALAMFLNL